MVQPFLGRVLGHFVAFSLIGFKRTRFRNLVPMASGAILGISNR